jgi:hypothetical protein
MTPWPLTRRSQADAPSPVRPLTIKVDVPTTMRAKQSPIAEALVALVRTRLEEAGVDRGIAPPEVTTHNRDVVEVSLDGRPVALVSTSGASQASVSSIASAVDQGVVRHRSLMLDEATARVHSERIAESLNDERHNLYTGQPQALLDVGISLRADGLADWRDVVQRCTSAVELTELLIDALAGDAIRVEVPERVVRSAVSPEVAFTTAREDLYHRTGLRLPDVTLHWTDVAQATVRLTINGVRLPVGATSAVSDWSEVVQTSCETADEFGHWLLRLRDVDQTLGQFEHIIGDLVGLAAARTSVETLSAVIRALYANGASVRNLPRILALLLDAEPPAREPNGYRMSDEELGLHAPYPSDPEVIGSLIRRRAAEDGWASGIGTVEQPAVFLPIELESDLVHPLSQASRCEAEWHLVRLVDAIDSRVTVVTHAPGSIAPVRKALMAVPSPQPQVIASQELPPHVRVPQRRTKLPVSHLARPCLSRVAPADRGFATIARADR